MFSTTPKTNVVAYALSCMSMGSVSHVEKGKKDLVQDVHRLARLGVRWKIPPMVVLWFIITTIHH